MEKKKKKNLTSRLEGERLRKTAAKGAGGKDRRDLIRKRKK